MNSRHKDIVVGVGGRMPTDLLARTDRPARDKAISCCGGRDLAGPVVVVSTQLGDPFCCSIRTALLHHIHIVRAAWCQDGRWIGRKGHRRAHSSQQTDAIEVARTINTIPICLIVGGPSCALGPQRRPCLAHLDRKSVLLTDRSQHARTKGHAGCVKTTKQQIAAAIHKQFPRSNGPCAGKRIGVVTARCAGRALTVAAELVAWTLA